MNPLVGGECQFVVFLSSCLGGHSWSAHFTVFRRVMEIILNLGWMLNQFIVHILGEWTENQNIII